MIRADSSGRWGSRVVIGLAWASSLDRVRIRVGVSVRVRVRVSAVGYIEIGLGYTFR